MRDKSAVLSLLSPKRISVIYLLVLVIAIFGITIPGLFLTDVTFQGVARSQAVVGILALAVLVPFIAGEFDISVGANLALSVALMAWMSNEYPGLGLVGMILIAIAACALVGLVNGILVGKLGLNSFIATLATSQVLVAIALKLSNNEMVVASLSKGFMDWGQGLSLGVPNGLFVTLAVALLVWYILQYTKAGRHVFASGFNREAARLSGVRSERVVVGSFIASGAIAGLAGVVFIAQVGTFSNSIGMPFLFPAFAAVFLGATQFNQRPNVWGTLLAIFTLALGVQGLQLWLSESGFWITPMFNGLALIAAVMFTRRQAVRKATAVEPTDTESNDPEPSVPQGAHVAS
ncbi:ABC transporter permease [Williamsia sp. D3]|uniref:ABC transporter permease n=1 Tax=Williamsia sp. D3 TaxID=1313067 RepID=UPI0003D372E9|nr:ABC transporter permease [Williamsia sp. D3]ETD33313.1 ABC transporter permease [Williamsia sp. D3]